MPKAIFFIGIILLIFGFTKIYEPETPPANPVEKKDPVRDSVVQFIQQFDSTITMGALNKNIPGGSYVITYRDQVLASNGFGVRELNSEMPVDAYTVFRLGSVSKGFAAVLAGMMYDQGVLSFDDSVASILPYFRLNDNEQTARVRVRHLLEHTTGLPRHAYTNLVEDGLTLERIIPRFEDVPLIDQEGRRHAYTNAAYSVIEKVLEQRTNTDFKTLLEEEIFTPLAMTQASADVSVFETNTNVAQPHLYSYRQKKRVPVSIKDNYYNAISAGGINASAKDMGQWLLLLTGNRSDLISESTLDEIFTPVSRIPNKRFSRHWDGVNESFYAMGWRVLEHEDQTIVYHGGYVNGFRSEIAFDRERQIGISILINSNSSYALEVIPEFFKEFNRLHAFIDSTQQSAIETLPASDE